MDGSKRSRPSKRAKPIGIKANELVRRIRDAHYEATKDLTPEQRAQFYRETAERALKEAREISAQGDREGN